MGVEFDRRGRTWACAMVVCFVACGLGGVRGAAQTTGTTASKQSLGEKIAASKNLVDINTATAAELKALPGMGDAYVQRIVAGRPYTAKNQLTQRGILPVEAYRKIKEFVIAHRVK